MDDKFLKPYEPNDTEEKIYKLWEESGFFNPDNLPKEHSEPFTIIMPPTNANGSLHAGHALVMTIEDIMTRFERMRGKKALWLPGTDHAGFETQVVYEKKLEKEGRSRFNMDRDGLYKEIMEFTQKNKNVINSQVKRMGASCDWTREKFTLDPDIIKTVYDTFKKLNDDGLVYRGKKIVNWCTKHQTSLSELETVSEEQEDPLYYMKYGPFVLATVRPETKFGDTAVAVNPNDKRYKKYIGKEIEFESLIGNSTLKVIADDFVDMEFGTGVVKVTPAHDPNDFEIGLRHDLEVKEVIDQFGKLNEKTGKYKGLSVNEARKKIAEDLKKADLLERVDNKYIHAVKKCYKCERVLEPRIMTQWFLKMKPLSEKVIKVIKSEEIKFIPEQYKKITLHWLENILDWNISRQIVWGIPIPAKICDRCDEGMVDLDDDVKTCPKCNGAVRNETDTFDTWFSSGQWPFAALGFPKSKDFKIFYPTNVMETAGEIIFFWVTRMIIFGKYVTGKIPFHTVYLHGLVLDAKGRKMSKSKGNVINPLTLIEKFGTDALRIGLVVGNTPGTSLSLSEDRIKGYKHFANKLWNVTRYILENTSNDIFNDNLDKLSNEYTEQLKMLTKEITKDMENYRFYLAGEKIYHYVWHELADKILEEMKEKIRNGDDTTEAQKTLAYLLKASLIMLHPFMPFITEEIWQSVPNTKSMLIITPWPK